MKIIRRVALLVVVSAAAGAIPAAGAQATPAASAVRTAPSERNAVELKRGMSADEVQRLLGKPRRTALKDSGGSAASASQGSLQWTYVWATKSSSDNVLRVDFAAKAPDEWYVNSWEWTNF